MAGSFGTPAGKGGRRPLDASINLVPFIDLLSCCISFLLITAVWVNMAQMDVAHKGKGGAPAAAAPQVSLSVQLTPDAHVFRTSDGQRIQVPLLGQGYDYARLAREMTRVRSERPECDEIVLHATDQVRYDDIIRTLDVLKSARFPRVSVSEQGI